MEAGVPPSLQVASTDVAGSLHSTSLIWAAVWSSYKTEHEEIKHELHFFPKVRVLVSHKEGMTEQQYHLQGLTGQEQKSIHWIANWKITEDLCKDNIHTFTG